MQNELRRIKFNLVLRNPFGGYVSLVAVAIGIFLYYVCKWEYLINVVVNTVEYAFGVVGEAVERRGNCLVLNSHNFIITKACTYIDWLLIIAPLILTYSKYCWRNIFAIIIIIIVWYSMNIIRICFAIIMSCKGYSWFLSHDLPDYILWYLTLLVFFFMWLRVRVWKK